MDVFTRNRKAIAYRTLRMTPAATHIMGGMDYETAYYVIFRTPLRRRLESLVAAYGDKAIVWELQTYGWDRPRDLLNVL